MQSLRTTVFRPTTFPCFIFSVYIVYRFLQALREKQNHRSGEKQVHKILYLVGEFDVREVWMTYQPDN